MKYVNIVKGHFKERPNRFIAYVEIDGKIEKVHVKNTGRCKELLIEDATVYLEHVPSPDRKTQYDLIGVQKKGRLINMDSQAPNKVVAEWLRECDMFSEKARIRSEVLFGGSRLDFLVEDEGEKTYIEVKGVTLEEDGNVFFPDAPSERAIKHVNELIKVKELGYNAMILFVIQLENVKCFSPNQKTQPEFGQALINAEESGVQILAYDCLVTADSLKLNQKIPVVLHD